MPEEFIYANIIIESPNQKHRYKLSVNDGGELLATKLVLKEGKWEEPRPEIARKKLAQPLSMGSENLR